MLARKSSPSNSLALPVLAILLIFSLGCEDDADSDGYGDANLTVEVTLSATGIGDVVVENGQLVYNARSMLYLYDSQGPSLPLDSLLLPNLAFALDYKNTLICAACWNRGVIIASADITGNLTLLNEIPTEFAQDVCIGSGIVVTVDKFQGVFIWDIESSSQMQQLSVAVTPENDSEVFLSAKTLGDQLFVVSSTGVKIVNISNPSNPVLDGEILGSISGEFTINNNILYLCMNNGAANELVSYDITTPLSPQMLSSVRFDPYYVSGISSADNRVFLSCWNQSYHRGSNFAILEIDAEHPEALAVLGAIEDRDSWWIVH